mmetsp:Transcript_16551/g.50090  ORF Transcript_16551/g.50090 Transcript_16551/m.50090 type:complete len:231 (-) Transcript_16551:177-869(-)|eukprot:CAMPEP_0198673810 /NCGR_PEP_ID=MMETSP1467-20131203/97594_1 /TAXON_ID=1462469 /ORGANISM="unid. sp., Strain CCMP2135" /LENGTH=230 /DNA_ID=CAMNT_0044410697 /DNA_START=44 /DNA_END=736 /DNA_ORIENTATION=+
MMKVLLLVTAASAKFLRPAESDVTLEIASFRSDANTFLEWQEMDDPVMGGLSAGQFEVYENLGHFSGTVENVPKLNAPGFCEVRTTSRMLVDASAYLEGGFLLTLKSATPEYAGYHFSFNAVGTPHHHGGHEVEGSYKTTFKASADLSTVYLPFSSFSWDWSDFTGDCATQDPDGFQHQCCSDNAAMCPDALRLKAITGLAVWAEAAQGPFQLSIQNIAVTLNNELSSSE